MGGFLIFVGTLAVIALLLRIAIGNGEFVTGWFFSQLWRLLDVRVTKRDRHVALIDDMRSRQRVRAKPVVIEPLLIEPVRRIEAKAVRAPPREIVIEPVVIQPVPDAVKEDDRKEVAKPAVGAEDYLKAIGLLHVLADCTEQGAKKAWAKLNIVATGPGGSPEMVKGLENAFGVMCEYRKWKK